MKFHKVLFVLAALFVATQIKAQETRGVWMARNSFGTKANIARQMDSLAQNNFNVVYVNVWSRGYPLFPSDVFYAHTGVSIDPTYAGRDILAECIAEGHRVGIQVYAWFEYGFVGCWTGNQPSGSLGPLFTAHPDWVGQQQNGTQMDGNNFYWMIQSKPECQNFLIAMGKEVLQKYDVDGIEMDRIRYSALTYGYDPFTVSLYQSEHNGAVPPTNTADASWIQWRATKLNQFVGRMYDSLKAVNVKAKITNAPSQYSSTAYTSYNNFCQDWKWWINNGKVDGLEMQIYVADATTFNNYAKYVKNATTHYAKINPSFAIKPGSATLTNAQILSFIDKMRALKFKGTAIWFIDDLESRMKNIKTNRFTTANYPYGSTANWRKWYAVTPVTNATNAVKTGTWSTSSLSGYNGAPSLFADSVGNDFIEYYANVPQTGWYEVYAYAVTSSNRATNAEYTVWNSSNTATVKYVDQSNPVNNGFVKLGDFQLSSGYKKIIKVSNGGLSSSRYVSGDAMMIVLNRRLSQTVAPRMDNIETSIFVTLNVYPNPVSSVATVALPERVGGTLLVSDITGRICYVLEVKQDAADVSIDMSSFLPGAYIIRVNHNERSYVGKIIKP